VAHRTARSTLDFLAEVAALLATTSELDDVVGPVLRLLAERVDLVRAGLALVDQPRGDLWLHAAHGLTPAEVRRAVWRSGEGLLGQVARGEVVVVPSLSADPRAKTPLERWDGRDRSFIAVPVQIDSIVIGTLSAYRETAPRALLDADTKLLRVVASMLAHVAREAASHRESPGDTSEVPRLPNLIGRSKAMGVVSELVGRVAESPATVLLTGESGTGKELVATAIHRASARARGAFVKVNCAALPEAVIESELFGHERGAFTGAHARRKGRFEVAHGGTLFLDEIGDLSAATQVKLLRVLQEGEFQRVGGNETLRVDVRIITATSRDLDAMIAGGEFRADLFYRLNVFPIRVPPLRERRGDVLLLTDHFVDMFNRAHGRSVRRVATSAIDMLMAYHWPGNVRELENCIERAVLLARGDVIQGHHLPPTLQTPGLSEEDVRAGLRAQVEAFERDLVQDALKSAGGNMASAARNLQITERKMGLRVAKYGLDPVRFKATTKKP
jgi:Nif-specific regulatory protein